MNRIKIRPPAHLPGHPAAAVLWLGAALLLGSACARPPRVPDLGRQRFNLLLITLDTTRADRIGAYGCRTAHTPVLDDLARHGLRFENCYTPTPLTLPAHATVMTGKEPAAHQVRNNGTYALGPGETTLAEVMKAGGFATQAMISAFVLQSKFGLDQGFDRYDDTLNISGLSADFLSEISADKAYRKFSSWLDDYSGGPFFTWIHFYDPHYPYTPPMEYLRQAGGDAYAGEIAFVDHYLGEIMQSLAHRDLLSRTLIVVAGDHGEAFGEHQEFYHGLFCYESTLRVPLIFYNPAIWKPGTVSRRVRLQDVMPTILDLFRLEAPAGMQGRSLAPLLSRPTDPAADPDACFESRWGNEEMGWAPLSGIIRNRYKYISLPQPELFDLQADPGERENLYLKKNRLSRELAQALETHNQAFARLSAAPVHRTLSDGDRRQLQALGYLATGGTFSPDSRIDPKQGVAVYNQIHEITLDLQKEDFATAEKKLERFRQAGHAVRIPQYFDIEYALLMRKNRNDEARTGLREAIRQFPELTRFKLMKAELEREAGNLVEAELLAKQVLVQDPLSVRAHILLARIHQRRGATALYLASIRQAARLEPGNAKLQVECASALNETGDRRAALAILQPLPGDALLEDDSPEVQANLVKLLIKLGQTSQARQILDRRIGSGKADADTWTQMGLARLAEGAWEEAGETFQRALDMKTDQPLALSGMGTVCFTLFQQSHDVNQLRRANDYYARARAADPGLVSAINGLGVVGLYRREYLRAIALFEEALRIDPDFGNSYFNLAIAHLGLGRRTEARRVLRRLQSRPTLVLSDGEKQQLQQLLNECGA